MWKIERFIKDNQQQLSDNEPLDGHEERFRMRLNKVDVKQKGQHGMSFWFSIAATLILLGSVVWLSLEPFKTSRASALNNVTAIEIPAELTQVLSYYNDQIEDEAQALASTSNDNISASIISDAARKQIDKLDAQLMSIEKEYARNPGSEAVKAAMVNTQRKKAEIVNCLNNKSQAATQGYRVGESFTQF